MFGSQETLRPPVAGERPPIPQGMPAVLGVALLVGAVVLAYLPGLPGTFLFDDYVNLPLLGAFGGVHDWNSLLLYATSGIADPTGRPVAQLSFLLDARNWPADPLPFKRTNIAIHACNALLLFWALHRLGLRTGLYGRTSLLLGFAGAALWALHPLHASTVLYIVQRHAQLVMLFSLLSALAVDCAVSAFGRKRAMQGTLLVSLALFAWGLAILSKSNGILLPLLLGLVALHIRGAESTNAPAAAELPRWTIWLFLACVAVALSAVLAASIGSILAPGLSRPWDYWDRVLTQPRALIDYLSLLLIPRIGSPGIFTDGYPLSTGLLSPATTAPALAILVALFGYAFGKVGKHPLALGLALFLVGHLLESGFVNLELFYEHRNYVPSALLFWALARLLLPANGYLHASRLGVLAGIALLLMILTALRAASWASPLQIAAVAERYAGNSERLALLLTSAALRQGRPDLAAERAHATLKNLPESAMLGFNLLMAECLSLQPTREAIEQTRFALSSTKRWNRNLYQWISERVDDSNQSTCTHYAATTLESLTASLDTSPVAKSDGDALQDILALRAELALAAGRKAEASDRFGDALVALPRYDAALWLAQRAQQLGGTDIAALHFAVAKSCLPPPSRPTPGMARLHAWLLDRLPVMDTNRLELEQRLSALPPPAPTALESLCDRLAKGR